ncbi:putative disease resistance RPP13-like protein 1 [Ananas comosus]|uniref:Putative disease resistance RPP13-like protein 1 n=1 Tax=Ananas comosus TaxID=4615 RepID=A0A199ULU8_ANACO|nr:putative disease resistance RPP13-like protein 1 [Ananas comosus]
MAAAFIPESRISAIVGKLVDTASSYVQQHEASGGMAGEVAGLRQALSKIELILTALEGTPIADRHKEVERWLWRLRDAVEGADDVLDELDYYELEKKIQARDRLHEVRVPVSRRKRKYVDFVNCIFSDDALKSLMEAVKELNKVAAGTQRITQIVTDSYGGGFTLRNRYDIRKVRETRWCFIENVVLGRDKERDRIVDWLTKQVDYQPSSSNIPTFAIVGESGAGKTALTQFIRWDKRVRGYFDKVMWVSVLESFSASEVRNKILEDVTSQSTNVRSSQMLKERLISMRFLLILDDVSTSFEKEWNELIPLLSGQTGSKILLTTENNSVADILKRVTKGRTESLHLNGLEESDYMMLFNKHAYPSVDPDEHEDLQLIGKQITSKLRGMPSAARVVGRVLSSRMDYGYWERILNYIMNLEQSEDGLKVLSKWRYDHLPMHLQMCFRYCSLFPRGYMFEKDKLISMWMASGLIQQPMHEKKRPEDIGAGYLNILSQKSFFNCKPRGPDEVSVYYYVKHDLLYELAQNTSSGECLRIEGVDQKNIPSMLRHLTLESATALEIRMISHLKYLRTLIINSTEFYNPEPDHLFALNEMLKGLKNGLGNLINMRHLHIPSDIMIKIPWIGKLTSLQELNDFNVREESCYRITELKDLKELRQLYVRNLQNVTSQEEAIEAKLNVKKNLESLTLEWSVETDELFLDNLQPNCNLKELKLGGYNGVKFPYWIESKFLPNLQSIVLFNCHKLENLPPLGQLKFLRLLHLNSMQAVKTVGHSFYGSNACAFRFLRELRFEYMPEWVEWVEWVQVEDRLLFPGLQILEIKDCPRLRRLPTLPLRLRQLSITNAGLDDFPRIYQFVGTKKDILLRDRFFPYKPLLSSLHIVDCPNLPPLEMTQLRQQREIQKRSFQSLELQERIYSRTKGTSILGLTPKIQDNIVPSTSERLALGRCDQFNVSLGSLSSLTSLSRFRMDGCVNVSSLPSAGVFERLTRLHSLEILNCKNLESLSGIQALRSLRFLSICGCGKLTADSSLHQPTVIDVDQGGTTTGSSLNLDELEIDHHLLLLVEPLKSLCSAKRLVVTDASSLACLPENWLLRNRTALQDITMYDAVCLHSLPPSMASFCSLHTLKLFHAPLIESLPNLPTSLSTLCITDCHPLLKARCQEDIGLDWCKIANIPHVSILERFHADDS